VKLIDKMFDRALGRALARRYRISDDPPAVYMDASKPITPADMAIMQAIAARLLIIGTQQEMT
jgi:hypothetical protein